MRDRHPSAVREIRAAGALLTSRNWCDGGHDHKNLRQEFLACHPGFPPVSACFILLTGHDGNLYVGPEAENARTEEVLLVGYPTLHRASPLDAARAQIKKSG